MKRKLLALLLAALMVASLVACGETAEQPTETEVPPETTSSDDPYADLEPITVKLVASSLASAPKTIATHEACDKITELTNGKITFEITDGGETVFGGNAGMFDLLRTGSYNISNISMASLSGDFPETDVMCWPYVFKSPEHIMNFFKSEYAEGFYEKVENTYGITMFEPYFVGIRHLTTNGVEVRKPEDLNGVKIRCMDSSIYVDGTKAMGAIPVPVAWSELYFALQTGVTNGEENTLSVMEEGKLYEVQDTLIKSAHLYSIMGFGANSEWWNSLPQAYKDVIQEQLYDRMNVQFAYDCEDIDNDYQKMFQEHGMKVIEDVDIDAFAESCGKAFKELFGDKPSYIEMYEAIQACEP